MSLEIHYHLFGCFHPPAEEIDLAKAAVSAGFEGIWTGDHFMPWLDSRPYSHHPWSFFGALMNEIPEVPVGTSVTCPMIRYRPPVLAQSIATLDNLFPGRLQLGVGVGEALNDAHFLETEWPDWETRATMLLEALEVMQRLWSSAGYLSYEGEYFTYDEIKLYTRPKTRIPIHWAGWGPKSIDLAAAHADHLITVGPLQQIEERIAPRYRDALEGEDRSREATVSTEIPVNIGDEDSLVMEIREQGEFVPFDTELDNPDPRAIQRVAEERLAEMSDAEVRDAHNISEDPADIVAELETIARAGVGRVLVGSTCGDPYRTIDVFESDVLPHFR